MDDHPAAKTLQRLRAGDLDLDGTISDARATIAPPRRADTAGRRALAVLERLSGGAPGQRGAIELERTLGQGGMGVVHLGTQVALGRKVAVKTLKKEHRTPDTAMQLLREAWVTGALEHPNVVPIYDLGLDGEGQPYIVLKRIEGVEWSALMGDDERVRERFGASDLLEWNLQLLMQVCNALGFAHSRGIVHRDLKPDNVMIGEFGEVYVLDWGIAVALRDDGSGRLPLASDARELCGTPSYMAPEMLDPTGARLSERTDVYLLGGMLYEILTDHAPHEGATLGAVLASVALSEPVLPATVPDELGRICRRALHADPDARFENAHQLRLALQGFLQRRGSQQLADEAEARLGRLIGELAVEAAPCDGEPAVARRLHLYNLFGECRFGFQQALRGWRGNEAASDGLVRATSAMVQWELGQGDAKAAATLAAGLPSLPSALRARIEAAARAEDEARQRDLGLQQIGREWDFSVGRRTRIFLAALLGALWTLLPLVSPLQHLYDSDLGMVTVPTLFLILMVALGVWARESMTKTVVNRVLMAAALFTMISQVLLHGGCALLHMPARQSQTLDFMLWFCSSGFVSIGVDRRLALGTLAYGAGFLVACTHPSLLFYVMAAANAVFTSTMVLVWSKSLTGPDAPERRR